MAKILLIRHALNDAVGNRFAGRMSDINLNTAGRQQALELAEKLSHLPIIHIYSSPLERALQTAEPISQRLQIPVTIKNDFTEIDFGDWTNRSFDSLEDDELFKRFNTFRSCTRIPNGETFAEVQARMLKGIEDVCRQHSNEMIALVSHADTIKAAITYYAGIHPDLFQRLEISPASVSIVEINDYASRIHLLNYTGSISV